MLQARGTWVRVSPEEPVHALMLRLQQIWEEGPTEEMLVAWKQMLMNTRLIFKKLPSMDAANWEAIRAREALGANFVYMYRTALQRCIEIITVAKSLGGLGQATVPLVAAAYREQVGTLMGEDSNAKKR